MQKVIMKTKCNAVSYYIYLVRKENLSILSKEYKQGIDRSLFMEIINFYDGQLIFNDVLIRDLDFENIDLEISSFKDDILFEKNNQTIYPIIDYVNEYDNKIEKIVEKLDFFKDDKIINNQILFILIDSDENAIVKSEMKVKNEINVIDYLQCGKFIFSKNNLGFKTNKDEVNFDKFIMKNPNTNYITTEIIELIKFNDIIDLLDFSSYWILEFYWLKDRLLKWKFILYILSFLKLKTGIYIFFAF